ncbi:MAG: hypothetical protein DBY32_08150 [Phascolarctobacterium sp.]|nr:MAG: hypothetical protein DBY32_08150 [Phascolarctobacterium sp.]
MTEAQKYVCPNCNGLVDYGTKFCPHCGNAFGSWGETPVINPVTANTNNLITEAEYRFSKGKLIHALVSIVTFKGTQVTVQQKCNWLGIFKTNSGFAQFDIMDIESIYIKKSYNGKFVFMFILCLIVTFLVTEWLILLMTIMFGFMMRDKALIVKYKGGYLKLMDDKDFYGTGRHDDPQKVLDYIKQYNPDCVHVLMD